MGVVKIGLTHTYKGQRIQSEQTHHANNDGKMIDFSFGNFKIPVILIIRRAENIVTGIMNTFQYYPIQTVYNIRSAPLYE